MEVSNELYPVGEEQTKAMLEAGPDGPIVMVNLLKYREKAEYPDGRNTDLSGREAYAIYGQAVAKLIQAHGGRVVFAGNVSHLTIGAVDELWDDVALAEYPNRGALVAMSTSAAYAEIAPHREAGLKGQLNIETTYSQGLAGPPDQDPEAL